MATAPQAAPGNNDTDKAAATATTDALADASNNARTETEKESDSFLDRETAGQVFDENDSGQQMADQMDDSMRSEMQAPTGSAPPSAENVPDELVRPSEANFTLPETQHQGKTLTADGDE
ncbi:hypothetical protein GCM10023172_09970 [Hymenobacter ginsengisoli]|uniref:Uncharacterized protein n=1 Tax=Hymenobacter ginsengisoli TaxID=1051626 RepID=A0ABP8Q5A1_9BACT|nr:MULTISPECIES: hypothetical protein [unclassified Hymenobacter]MBO2032429.1 hypothetical protein [Hymenobacter sp. BT559]